MSLSYQTRRRSCVNFISRDTAAKEIIAFTCTISFLFTDDDSVVTWLNKHKPWLSEGFPYMWNLLTQQMNKDNRNKRRKKKEVWQFSAHENIHVEKKHTHTVDSIKKSKTPNTTVRELQIQVYEKCVYGFTFLKYISLGMKSFEIWPRSKSFTSANNHIKWLYYVI